MIYTTEQIDITDYLEDKLKDVLKSFGYVDDYFRAYIINDELKFYISVWPSRTESSALDSVNVERGEELRLALKNALYELGADKEAILESVVYLAPKSIGQYWILFHFEDNDILKALATLARIEK